MPSSNVSFTATTGQPSNRGQSVLITMGITDQAKLPTILVGQKATISNSGNIGYVSNIDKIGGTLTIKPQYPNGDLSSNVGSSLLLASETINVQIP
jgi:hypothetical protein